MATQMLLPPRSSRPRFNWLSLMLTRCVTVDVFVSSCRDRVNEHSLEKHAHLIMGNQCFAQCHRNVVLSIGQINREDGLGGVVEVLRQWHSAAIDRVDRPLLQPKPAVSL